jgi:hypothetical protein
LKGIGLEDEVEDLIWLMSGGPERMKKRQSLRFYSFPINENRK